MMMYVWLDISDMMHQSMFRSAYKFVVMKTYKEEKRKLEINHVVDICDSLNFT